jgi:hypothetical protein
VWMLSGSIGSIPPRASMHHARTLGPRPGRESTGDKRVSLHSSSSIAVKQANVHNAIDDARELTETIRGALTEVEDHLKRLRDYEVTVAGMHSRRRSATAAAELNTKRAIIASMSVSENRIVAECNRAEEAIGALRKLFVEEDTLPTAELKTCDPVQKGVARRFSWPWCCG